MSLFMVIYIAGQVGATVGPLPYGIEECERQAAEKVAEGNEHAATPEGYTLRDIRIACEFHAEPPQPHFRLKE
jgi:hypothetical protein